MGSYADTPTWEIPAKWLRPIRPSDEQDEMLRIVGLPNKEKEKA